MNKKELFDFANLSFWITSKQFDELSLATNNTTQSIKEFSASWKSFKMRYHPIVWFVVSFINSLFCQGE
jgi:hypothetical protein